MNTSVKTTAGGIVAALSLATAANAAPVKVEPSYITTSDGVRDLSMLGAPDVSAKMSNRRAGSSPSGPHSDNASPNDCQ